LSRILQRVQILSRMRARPIIDNRMMGIMTIPPLMISDMNITYSIRLKKEGNRNCPGLKESAGSRNRTTDTRIFSPTLKEGQWKEKPNVFKVYSNLTFIIQNVKVGIDWQKSASICEAPSTLLIAKSTAICLFLPSKGFLNVFQYSFYCLSCKSFPTHDRNSQSALG
jgi:hypothetical protein